MVLALGGGSVVLERSQDGAGGTGGQAYSVTVLDQLASSGGNSIFSSITASEGGGKGSYNNQQQMGNPGGSGGGTGGWTSGTLTVRLDQETTGGYSSM